MQTKIRKAVIAAAGFGTRFLPQTKAMPKEMLPLIDKPIIQYIVEELVDAGIEDIVIVTGYHKRSIEDHFDAISADLRANLSQAHKVTLLDETKKVAELANFAYIRQKGPLGNATPLLNAEHLLGDEPFLYSFADDFVTANPSRFKQIIATHQNHGGMVLTCVRVADDEAYSRYGFVGGEQLTHGIVKMNQIIEKPGSRAKAPSDLASVGGYLFEPSLFAYLHQDLETMQAGHEFALQPTLQRMMQDGHSIYGCEIQNGKFHDTGNKLDYLKTVVDFALQREDIKDEFRDYLSRIVG